MRYWLQYHNYDKLGYLPGGYEPDFEDLSTLDTSKYNVSGVSTGKASIRNAVGDCVFFIVGYGGKSKRYVLWSWCEIKEIKQTKQGFNAFGEGRVVNPPASLDGEEFALFKKKMGNFGLGFQPVTTSPFLPRLLALAREHGNFIFESDSDDDLFFPEEVSAAETRCEGAVRQALVNAYERSAAARRLCIEYHGTVCCICDFDFGRAYGKVAEGLIHVHHLRPLSEIGEEYVVNPIDDLRPVCPNCHAVLHRHRPAFSIEEVRRFLRSRGDRASTV